MVASGTSRSVAPGSGRSSGTPGLVSCILSTYNHARYVEQALDSIRAQTYGEIELIVVDDASADDTVAIIRRWNELHGLVRVLLAGARNVGSCRRLNEALDATTGEFLCWMSGDDWMEPDRLRLLVGRLNDADVAVSSVYSDARRVDEHGEPLEEPSYLRTYLDPGESPPEGDLYQRLLRSNFLAVHAVLSRRAAVIGVGGFDESLTYDDWDMWLRLSAAGNRFIREPGMLVNYRVHGQSMSYQLKNAVRLATIQLLAKHADTDAGRRAVARGIATSARMLYASGADPTAARAALRTSFRTRPGLKSGLLVAAATARIPYRVLDRTRPHEH